jgi:hypothetical protein
MITRLKRHNYKESGMALILVLVLLALGGLTIATSLNYVSTLIYDNQVSGWAMDCMYSAGAGVEYAIWALENNEAIPVYLSDNVNGKSISIDIEDNGIFTLYCGDLIYVGSLPSHYDWITTSGSAVCDGPPCTTCNYTISVYLSENASALQRKIIEIGAKLPAGYSYVPGSSDNFTDNVALYEPDESGGDPGDEWIRWLWNPGSGPVIDQTNPTVNQTFQIMDLGSGSLVDDYTWVQVQSNDIGLVGEITGERKTVTGTAIGPATVDSVIEADLVLVGGTVYVMSWQVLD